MTATTTASVLANITQTGNNRDYRCCRRCDCRWAVDLGDIPCWNCDDIDSHVVYDNSWSSGEIRRVHPLDPLPGDTDDPVFAPTGVCYPPPRDTSRKGPTPCTT